MAFVLKVGGVDKTTQVIATQPVTIEQQLNERATAGFVTKPGYVPARFAEVSIYEVDGTTLKFGGVVLRRQINPIQARNEPYSTKIECGDYFTYFDWAFVDLTYSSPVTLKTVLTDLIAALPATYGITLDAGQVDGPTLSAFSWVSKRASDGVRELTDRTNYVGRISPAKAFEMFVPGTDAAPVAITDASPHCLGFTYSDSDQIPANTVRAICGPSAALTTTFQVTADGVATSWEVDIQAVVGGWTQGYVLEDAVVRTLSGPAGGGYYEWDDTAGRGTLSVGIGATPGAGVVLTLVYTAQFPFTAEATAGATPEIMAVYAFPDVTDYAQGQEIAAGLLDQLDQQPRTCSFPSLDAGWLPGQALSVALTARLTADFVLTSVMWAIQLVHVTPRWVVSSIKAIEGSFYQGSYLDEWRLLTGSGSGIVTGTGSGGGGTTTVLASPVYMGGSYTQSITNPTAKTKIQGAVPYVATASFTGRLRVNLKARDTGVGVKAVISDGTTDIDTSVVTSQTFVDTSVVVPIVSGQTYWVYVQNNAAGDGYVGYAQLEAA
jgi:hypothetical protein